MRRQSLGNDGKADTTALAASYTRVSDAERAALQDAQVQATAQRLSGEGGKLSLKDALEFAVSRAHSGQLTIRQVLQWTRMEERVLHSSIVQWAHMHEPILHDRCPQLPKNGKKHTRSPCHVTGL